MLQSIGGMFAQAAQNVFITEVNGELDVLAARALGGQLRLTVPDTSAVVVAENSRLLLTKMEYDPQSQSRLMLMHLVVGKVRATVAQAAITLARVRQSNFAISTPTAVAAARGTILWVFTDGQKSMMAVEPEVGFAEGSSEGVWRQ